MSFKYFIGIDVSKDSLAVYDWNENKYTELKYSKSAITNYVQKYEKPEEILVVLENTGAYERECVQILLDLGVKIHKTNNSNFKHWVQFRNIRTKTDKIDAKMLARYAFENWENLILFNPLSEKDEERKQLLVYLTGLKKFRAQQKNQLKSPGLSCAAAEIQLTIETLNRRIEEIEKKVKDLSKSDKDFTKKVDLLTGYKGIGETTAINVLSAVPELGKVSSKTISSLVGVAPHRKDSGKKQSCCSTKFLGRARVKPILFTATLSAIRYNKNLSKIYNRLISRGKKKMVAIVACMRKMIIHMNAIIRDGHLKEA